MRRIRIADREDLDAIEAIFQEVHTEEEEGRAVIGWNRRIYPTRATAEAALERGDIYVLEEEGVVFGTAIINELQVDAYEKGHWEENPPEEKVLVLHTLAISPRGEGRGLGKAFVAFYEEEALRRGRPYLRLDTNAKNQRARFLYRSLGYREADIVPCVFNGLPGVNLVLLEKKLEEPDKL